MRALTILLTLLLTVGAAFADEGMWLMTQLDELDLKEKGLKVSAEDIWSKDAPSLLGAIVNMGGASAAFVSPRGLVLTNHHVAFGAVQRASTRGTDYLSEGFYAQDMGDEIEAPGQVARIITDIRDVTDEIHAAAAGAETPLERQRAIKRRIREITEAIEASGQDIEARIAENFEGGQYLLYEYKRFEDVRLVYIPPRSIGNYGGEVDNWMWPRHTGDFAFLRIYVSPEGVGREYHEDNVPFEPRRWLRMSTDNLDEGDMTFILGFPGKTTRYPTHYMVRHHLEEVYPHSIDYNQKTIDLIEAQADGSKLADIKIAGRTRWLYNGMKKYKGVLAGMVENDFLQMRRDFDRDLQEWIEDDKGRRKQWGRVLERIGAGYEEKQEQLPLSRALRHFSYGGPIPLSSALYTYSMVKEREKPLTERRPSFSESYVDRIKRYLRFAFYNYFEPIERALMTRGIENALAMPDEESFAELRELVAQFGTVDELVDHALANTEFTDGRYVSSLFDSSSSYLESMDDPMMVVARAIYPTYDEYQDLSEQLDAYMSKWRQLYMEALLERYDGLVYPDANGTVRLTWGEVRGYPPRDAVWYEPFTSLSGVVAKDEGTAPFDMPEKLGELHEEREFGPWEDPELKDVPVAFLHDTDITGGNSGSSVLNARGELIGVAFDGNWEWLLGDWLYNETMQRTISVDSRYVLFNVDKVADLKWLLEEMQVRP